MTASTVLSVVGLVVSLVALSLSTLIAGRQARLTWGANHIPVILNLLGEYRSGDFARRERRVWESLPGEFDPAEGMSALPAALQEDVYNVCTFYQTIAYLVAYGVYDDQMAYLSVHYRLLRTWHATEQFIQAERRIRGNPYSFLNFFEDFARSCESRDPRREYLVARQKAVRRYRKTGSA